MISAENSLPQPVIPRSPADLCRSYFTGNLLIGQAWPDEIRFIFEETLLPYDLLYIEYGLGNGFFGSYADGFIALFSDSIRDSSLFLSVLAHEFAHAHQYALMSIDGLERGTPAQWAELPEGKAYAAARAKDWAEVGESEYDRIPYYRNRLTESAAEIAAYYWGIDRWGAKPILKNLEETAPNRL